MYILIATETIMDKKTYYILDTDDLSITKCDKSYIVNLLMKYPQISVKNLEMLNESDDIKLRTKSFPYGKGTMEMFSKNYLFTAHKLERYGSKYRLEVYKLGVEFPIFTTVTPNSRMDYLTFNVQSFDDKYLVIDASGMDKHYYREDREEYFGITIILNVTSEEVKVLRQDKTWDIEDSRNFYAYENGIMNPNV